MKKYILAATLFTCTAAYANDTVLRTHKVSNSPLQTPWSVIGTYETAVDRTVKFIKPAEECVMITDASAKNDFLLQLRNCHQKRKGWLKI
jgi:hypothetical protein